MMRLRRFPLQTLALVLGCFQSTPARAHPEPGDHAQQEVAIQPPELLYFEPAVYPEGALAEGRAAEVELLLDISEEGTVLAAGVLVGAGFGFDEAAVAAAYRFRFSPAQLDGEPLRVRVPFTYVFELSPALVPELSSELPPQLPLELPTASEPYEQPPYPGVDAGDSEYETHVQSGRDGLDSPATVEFGQEVLPVTIARTADDYLRLSPGLLAVQHGAEGKGLQLLWRGFDAAHGQDVEVLLEGIPINEPANLHGHGYVDLGGVIAELVQSVKVAPGVSRLHQGPFATAGTISYQLGKSIDAVIGADARIEGGTTGRARGAVTWAPADSNGQFAAVEGMVDSGFGQGRGAWRVAALGRGVWATGAHSELRVLTLGHFAEFGLPPPVPVEEYISGKYAFLGNPLGHQSLLGRSTRVIVGVTHNYAQTHLGLEIAGFGGWRGLSLDDNYTGSILFPEKGDRRLQAQAGWFAGARAAARWSLAQDLTFLGGLQWRFDILDQTEDRLDNQGKAWRTDFTAAVSQHLLSAWSGLLWSPAHWLRVEAGVRLEGSVSRAHDAEFSSTARLSALIPCPRVALSFPFHSNWTAYASYGRGVRPADGRVALANGRGGASADFAVADSVELGARWQPSAQWMIAAQGFGSWMSGDGIFDHITSTLLPLGNSRRLGATLIADYRPFTWLQLSLDITGVHAVSLQDGSTLPGAPKWIGSGRVVLRPTEGFFASLRLAGQGPRPLLFGATSSAWFVGELALGARRGPLEWSLQVENLWNHRWRLGEYAYASHFGDGQASSALPRVHYSAGSPAQARLTASVSF